ncbi:MAG: tRNA uridine(34) 5-carboxymethylaminomethyl modification radical SAM/GNAT enzyme Elp3 [Candidatus Woesearchaeota archaeon]
MSEALGARQDYLRELIRWIIETKPSKEQVMKEKSRLSRQYHLARLPTDIEILLHAGSDELDLVRPYLQTKPSRTSSGVAVVATMTEPFECPHGACIYCPGGPSSTFGDTPRSYTGKEPSTMRGMRNDYDPYRIIFNRLEQYIVMGQNADKVDQIIMGGTFCALPEEYQREYIYYSFKAYNDFSREFFPEGKLDMEKFKRFFELPGDIYNQERGERIKKKVLALKKGGIRTLEEEHAENEKSHVRCIGLTIETKPDWGLKEHGLKMLELGATRIEIGVQTVYDDILESVNRGHNIEDTKRSIGELRDLGFKLNFHMMPGLPDVDGKRISKEKDIESLRIMFDDEDFRPDMLKIYPTLVMPGTQLDKMYKDGTYRPLDTEEAADIIAEAHRFIPEYCRVMRVQRDIPTNVTSTAEGRTNLRQYVMKLAEERGIGLRDIRSREIKQVVSDEEPEIVVREYGASDGKEFFISMELPKSDKILGFVRLRFPHRSLHPVIEEDSALIRELHVYGSAVAIGKQEEKVQHKGLGRRLMEKAERIASENDKKKMVVISGVGVRGYYRKLGYGLEKPYMVKRL